MKQYIGDFFIAGVAFLTLTLTGISVNQPNSSTPQEEVKNIDSLVKDTQNKSLRVKALIDSTKRNGRYHPLTTQ